MEYLRYALASGLRRKHHFPSALEDAELIPAAVTSEISDVMEIGGVGLLSLADWVV